MKEKSWFDANRSRYESAKKIIKEEFPGLFDSDDPMPLKIGIHNDIYEKLGGKLSKRHIRIFLKFWTKRGEYHASMKKRGYRVDLDGNCHMTIKKHRDFSASRVPVALRVAV